ncbi:HNH endonuclease [Mycolicibacterium peregrinum]|uniref:HNH endonuclease n=1 Tax=Mycolicibacterium peregrinum TaxID=43304 RepID=UPI003AB06BED
MEHVAVLSESLGRALLPDENVHHINGVRDDNRVENLELWTTRQPKGQRVEDKVEWAISLLRTYRPGALSI